MIKASIKLLAGAALFATATAASANITFDLPVIGIRTFTENGYTFTADRLASINPNYGNPGGSLFTRSIDNGITFDITAANSFSFTSFDLRPNGGSAYYKVSGFLNGESIYTLSGDQPREFFSFVTIASGTSLVFDRLNFTIVSLGSSANVDNIRLAAAVPEPATWAMMLLGFGMVAGAARYRRRSMSATLA